MPGANDTAGDPDCFDDDQRISGNHAMKFQRFRMVPPGTADDVDDNEEEDNDDEDENEMGSGVGSFISRKMKSSVVKSSIVGDQDGEDFEDGIEALYEKQNLNEKVDQLTGVAPKLYADVDESAVL